MATGASTPSSRRTSSPVQRCEASERTGQPTGANDRPAEGLASTSNTSNTVGHPSFGSAVSRASAADVSRSSEGSRQTAIALRHVPAACGVCMDCGLAPVKSALATLGVCPRSAEVGPDACRAASERRASARRCRRSASHSAGVAATAFCSAGSAANKIAGERLRLKRKTAMIV